MMGVPTTRTLVPGRQRRGGGNARRGRRKGRTLRRGRGATSDLSSGNGAERRIRLDYAEPDRRHTAHGAGTHCSLRAIGTVVIAYVVRGARLATRRLRSRSQGCRDRTPACSMTARTRSSLQHVPPAVLREVMAEDRRVVDRLRQQTVPVVGLDVAQVLDDGRPGGIRPSQLQDP